MTSNEIISQYRQTIGCLPGCADSKVHVAIVDAHTASLIIEGKKQIETRFSETKHAPYGKINEGDTILIKKSGGAVVGIAQAARVLFYSDLNEQKVELLKSSFNDLIQARQEFWKQKKTAKYATLIYLDQVAKMKPFWIKKTDRSGWRIYNNSAEIGIRTEPGKG